MYICCKGAESCHVETCVRSQTVLLCNSPLKLIALKFYSKMYCIYVILPKLQNYTTHCSFICFIFLVLEKLWHVPEFHRTHDKPPQCCFAHVSRNLMWNINFHVVFFVKSICTLIIFFLFELSKFLRDDGNPETMQHSLF